MKKTIIILLFAFTINSSAQNLFPVKLDNCKVDVFCLDCGDIQAGYDEAEFSKLLDRLNNKFDFEGVSGAVEFQVLVQSNGRACVLSHTDQSNNPITIEIIKELNGFNNWTPAITNGVKEEKASINVFFTVSERKLTGLIERNPEMDAGIESSVPPQNPEIYNKTYDYKNEHLKDYKITVWNSKNSNLSNDINNDITIDLNGLIWLTLDNGLVTFDGKVFKKSEQNIVNRGASNYYALATDNNNIKWVYAKENIFSFDNSKWTKHDSAEIGINGAYDIVNNPKTGEVFFCSDEGLTIYKDKQWANINKSKFKKIPSNRVAFAKRDSKNRIWIGTFSGTAMIDENNNLINYETTKTILRGKCITSMDEDENGNIYFTLFEFDRKDKETVNNDEGIAILYADGTFKQFTTENSGMPFNHANCVLYDRNEKVLWISTERAGLIRYDLKEGWENYHNQNSDIPTSYISTMSFDDKGNLYLATSQGLVKIERK